jgi:uncharacterized membrane protein YozB (DUF420 family)
MVIAMVSLTDATISLAIQITVLVLLIIAWTLKNRKKFRQHGITMTTAVVLHIITILYVMIPSLYNFTSSPGAIALDLPVIITFIHVALGFITLALGIWLVTSWHFSTDLKTCFSNRKLMKPTIALWIIAILLGIVLYVSIWASLLLG